MEYTPVYLLMITEQNNNKYYSMYPNADGTFTAKYGRVGGGEQSKTYPMSKWESLKASKIKKGYKEVTNLMTDVIEDSKVEDTPVDNDKFGKIKIHSIKEFLKRLWDFSNRTIQSAYKVKSSVVTQAMVDKAQEQIDEISSHYLNWTVEEFNQALLALFTTIPRKMKYVKDYLANDSSEFANIIVREQDLLDTMAGQVYQKKTPVIKIDTNSDVEIPSGSILDELGISMRETTEEEVEKLKKAMGDSADKYYKSWTVTNFETEEAYNKFVGENQIGNIQLCCHGSRNANWLSIIKQGLKIRPSNAVSFAGTMWGPGIYFSNPKKYHGGVRKSIGYTSLGGYWTREYQNCGFLAFYDVALGEPYDVYNFDPKYYSMNFKKLQEINPKAYHLFAHGNTSMLKNDELVVYDHRQMTIRYLVEIR